MINLLIYENNNKKLVAEVYFKDRLEPYTIIECGNLLGDLLAFEVEINKHETDEVGQKTTVKIIRRKPLERIEQSELINVLSECFLEETFYEYDTYSSINLILYYEFCEKNHIEICFDTFMTFLQMLKIPFKEYKSLSCSYDYESRSGLLLEEPLNNFGANKEMTLEERFLEILKIKKGKEAFYYEDCQYTDFIFILTYHILLSERKIKRCDWCGKYYTPSKSDEKYCSRTTINVNRKKAIEADCPYVEIIQCKEEAAKENRKKRNSNNIFLKKENSVRTRLANRLKAKNVDGKELMKRQVEYYEFMDEKIIMKNKLKENKITPEEYLEWLNQI